MSALPQSRIDSFHENGFLFPIRVFTTQETRALRGRLEEAEAGAAPGRGTGGPARSAHHPRLGVGSGSRSAHRGADLGGARPRCAALVHGLVHQGAGPAFVSYHQDATYWGLEPHHVATAWIALSDASEKTGPMRFVPGSHKGPLFEQHETYGKDNLLSRGQVVKTDVDESQTVLAPLAPGEMSMHDVRVIHGSEPNLTGDRRIGMVLRYCATDVRQTKAEGDRAILVKGVDNHRHFEMIPRPREDLGQTERELAHQHARTRYKALMED